MIFILFLKIHINLFYIYIALFLYLYVVSYMSELSSGSTFYHGLNTKIKLHFHFGMWLYPFTACPFFILMINFGVMAVSHCGQCNCYNWHENSYNQDLPLMLFTLLQPFKLNNRFQIFKISQTFIFCMVWWNILMCAGKFLFLRFIHFFFYETLNNLIGNESSF